MYKILDLSGKMIGDKWVWEQFVDWGYLKANGYEGIYIMSHKDAKDNPYMATLFDQAKTNGFRVGFFIVIQEGSESYAVQMMDLNSKCKARPVTLPPAILVAGIPAGKTVHQFRGDFQSYFDAFLVQKFDHVVVGLNQSTKSWIFQPFGTDDVGAFKTLMTQDKVRLWLWDWKPVIGDPSPWSYAWIWGSGLGVNQIEYASTPSDPEIPENPEVPEEPADPVQLNRIETKIDALNTFLHEIFK